MKTKIFVSGASGFIGRKLCIVLANQGYQVHALCRKLDHPYLIKHENITFFEGDITNKESLIKAMQGCNQVYHTAALAKMWCKNKNDFYEVNVIGTRNLLESATNLNVKRIVYTSTCGVWGPTFKHPMIETDPRIYGFPIDYERTKYLAELEVNAYFKKGLNVVIVNPSRVFGEGPITDSNTVSKMIKGYLKGSWRVIPGSGERVANYAFLDDVIHGHIAAMENGKAGERYILGGEDISFNEFFETLGSVSNEPKKMIRIPQKLIKLFSEFELLKTKITGWAPFFLPEFADRLKYDQKYSSNKAIEQLNYSITPFATGLEKTVHYIQRALKDHQ